MKTRNLHLAVAVVVSLAAISVAICGQEDAGKKSDSPCPRFIEALAKGQSIKDFKATVTEGAAGGPNYAVFRCSYSVALGLTRLQVTLAPDLVVDYFIDAENRSVYAQARGNLFRLTDDSVTGWLGGVNRWLFFQSDPLLPQFQDIYYVGSETIDSVPLDRFLLLARDGTILRKVWIGQKDGFVYRQELMELAFQFKNVSINAGLDEQLLRPKLPGKDIPSISQKELDQLLKQWRKPEDKP